MKSKFYVFVVLLFVAQNILRAQAPQLQLSSNNGTQTYARAFAAASEKLPASRIPHGVLYDKVAGWAGLDF